MLVVTYSSDHNHPWPASRNNHHKSHSKPEPKVVTGGQDPEPELEPETESEEKLADPTEGSLMISTADDELGWFGEMEGTPTTLSAMLESPTFTGDDADVASIFLPMRGEDEWLFADLGELPECSVVFRRRVLESEEEGRRCAASWFGTTS